MEEKIMRTKRKLQEMFYHMNDSWLDECMNFYSQEMPNATEDETLDFVKLQWELSNLRETSNEKGCLPRNLVQQKSTILGGKYILQVEKAYDIATSKYKQLEAIRHISNENVSVTEAEKTQTWETKSKRMMELWLTDGIQDVQAIEHQPIASLKDTILPGYKVMIKGPVQCRRGIIMMTEMNITGIGGEVEDLLITNAKENLLARALGLPENPDPYNDTDENNENKQESDNPTDLLDDDFDDVNFDEINRIESQNTNNQQSARQTPRNQILHENNFNRANNFMAPVGKRKSTVDLPVCFEKEQETENFEFPDDDDDFSDVLEPKIQEKNNVNNQFPRPSTSTASPLISNHFDEDDDDIILIDEPEIPKTNNFNAKGRVPNEKELEEIDDLDDVDWDDLELEKLTQQAIQESLKATPRDHFHMKKPVQPEKSFKTSEIVENIQEKTKIINSVKISSENSPINSSSLKRVSAVLTPPPSTSSKIHCNRETPKNSKIVRTITEFFKKQPPPSSSVIPKICDFIVDVKKYLSTDEKIVKKIWGKIDKVGKLQKHETEWSMECTILDDTGVLAVTFSPKLLDKELGYTVPEFHKLKKMRKIDPEIEPKLRIALRNADTRFQMLDALLEIEFIPNKKPQVISITELTQSDRNIIKKNLEKLGY